MVQPVDSATEQNWNNEQSGNENELIAEAYERDAEKPALASFKQSCRESRKFGFPIVSANPNKGDDEQLKWAARLLISLGQSWPAEDIPDDFELIAGSRLHNDARHLVENALGNSRQVGL